MALKVADLYLDVHADLGAARDEISEGLTDDALPVKVAIDEITGGSGGAHPSDEMALMMGDMEENTGESATALASLAGFGALASGSLTAIMAVLGVILATVSAIGIATYQIVKIGMANSQFVAMISSFLNDSLGALFDMLIMVIFASVIGYLIPHIDRVKEYMAESIPAVTEAVDALKARIYPALGGILLELRDTLIPIGQAIFDVIYYVIWPYLEMYINAFTTVIPPLLEVALGLISDVIAPVISEIAITLGEIIAPLIEGVNDLLDGPIGHILGEISSLLVDDLFPWFKEYILPVLGLLLDIVSASVAPILRAIFDVLDMFMPVIEFAVQYVIAPLIREIMTMLEPVLRVLIPVLETILYGIQWLNEHMFPTEWLKEIESGGAAAKGVEPILKETEKSLKESYQSEVTERTTQGGGTEASQHTPNTPSWLSWPTRKTQEWWEGATGGWWGG